MSDSIWIRLSQMGDAGALMELDSLVWDEHSTPAQIEWKSREHYLQKCPPGSQLIAGIGEEICGYLGFDSPTPLESNRHVYDINIAIHPSYQRRGVGRKLMEAVKQHAAGQGIRKLSLRVLASNSEAFAFYQSCGFMEQGRLVEEFYLDGQYVDDILMWCPVEAH
ncbi:ribosomal protein S18 acetylase RimI-like enzyme [Fontibacillus phaseoli]|uniref:Ribosomal protein S18 acetylase RimI-like enzyme n=2 Tax=Fontibacillus phaseoli TaxID=1416533 RepID=A0A369BCP0_9BACL|nr:ribosomal protein S18 acetylase RimI-like enzyme [Fontibacillus phaseoli]